MKFTEAPKTAAFVLYLALASFCAGAEALQPVLPFRPFQAVILPAEVARANWVLAKEFTGFWTPTDGQVAIAEKSMTAFFKVAPNSRILRPLQRKLSVRVRDEPEKYIRQYIGVVRDGREVIYCIGNSIGLATAFGPDDWRRHPIMWADTRNNWEIDYDVAAHRCRRFYFDEGY